MQIRLAPIKAQAKKDSTLARKTAKTRREPLNP
jgi:hypothetical protein